MISSTTEAQGQISEKEPISRQEWWIASGGLFLLLLLKLLYTFHLRIDSDEPQHLHTVWAWANGLLPYRDVFDNHMPLFQWLCAPLFRAFGERPDIVSMMRLAMIPLFFGMLWAAYRITALLHSARAGLWAMLCTGFCPKFFFVSSEYRTDDLWSLVWLIALVVLLKVRFTGWRAFGCGLLVGTAFAISMKSTLLVGTLALSSAVVLVLRWNRGEGIDWRRILQGAVLFVAGTALFPLAIMLFFRAQGAWEPFVYCVFKHNVVPGVLETNGVPIAGRPYYFPVTLALLLFLAWRLLRSGAGNERFVLILLAAGFYLSALWSYWPILSAEDYEPFYPMLFSVLVPAIFQLARRWSEVLPPRVTRAFLLLTVAGFFQFWLAFTERPFTDATVPDVQMLADVLKLTVPGQYLMDGKGETVFRPRPYYYAMETMTDARFVRGLLTDDVAARIIEKKPPVARLQRLPHPAAHKFVAANYVHVTPQLLVLGKELSESPSKEGGVRQFSVAIPERYAVVDAAGHSVPGKMDGQPMKDAISLDAGPHSFTPDSPSAHLFLFWASAAEKGYRPQR